MDELAGTVNSTGRFEVSAKMDYLTTKGVSLSLASGLVIGLWKSRFTPLSKVLKTLPQYATEDLTRGVSKKIACLLILGGGGTVYVAPGDPNC